MECPSLMRKKEKKRKKNFKKKREENLKKKKKVKSNHLVIQCICLLTQIKAIVPSGGVWVPHPSRPWSLSRRVAVMVGGEAGLASLVAALGPQMRVHTVFLCPPLYSRVRLLSYRCSLFIRAVRAWGTHLASKLAF